MSPISMLHAVSGAILLAIAAGCSGDDDHDDSGKTSEPDVLYWCVCVEGHSFTVESNPSSVCESSCEDYGGIDHYEKRLFAVGTPECDAYCGKVDALGCGSCDEAFFCAVPPGGCVEASAAKLACQAETGTFECNESGNGWSSSSGCSTFEELCAADGGT